MKYAVEMGPDAVIYVYTRFHKDWLRHSKRDSQTHRQHGDRIRLL
jgi:hypothetical protein